MEDSTETLPAHIAELQKLREACGGLGVDISDAHFAGVISLSMLTPSWDPVIGTLGGVLDPKVIITCLNTEWSWCQGPTSSDKNTNVVFQTSNKSHLKCNNCGRATHFKARCWAKGGRQEGQYTEWFKGKRGSHTTNTVKTVSETPIVLTYGSISQPDVWIADSAATVHVSCNHDDFTSYWKHNEC